MAAGQSVFPRDQIRILALRALVKEREHRILRRQRCYVLGGAISLISWTAVRGTRLSPAQCFVAIREECERLTRWGGISEEMLLQAAREWAALPEKDRLNRSVVVTPTFAALIKASRPRRARQSARTDESPTLF